MKFTVFQLKYRALQEVKQVSLRLMYSYLLANDGTITHEYGRPRLRHIGVCLVLPKFQALVKTALFIMSVKLRMLTRHFVLHNSIKMKVKCVCLCYKLMYTLNVISFELFLPLEYFV